MNGETGGIKFPISATDDIAVHIHPEERVGGDFVEHVTIVIDKEMVRFTWNTRRHVRIDQIGPAQVIHDMIHSGQFAACFPLSVIHIRRACLECCGHVSPWPHLLQ